MSRLGQSQRVRWRTELLLRLKDKNESKDVVRGTVAQLRDEALLGNARDYKAAITALGRLTHWNEAISLYSEYAARRADNFQAAALELLFRRPVPPAGPAVAAAIGACGKGGAWQHAVSCLEGMKASKVDLNATCYGIGVSACARNDQVDASFVLLEAALAEDLENSGGPLLNSKGQVIGMNTAVIAGATGTGFAIPEDTVSARVGSILKFGYVKRAGLGLYLGQDGLAQRLSGRPGGVVAGLQINSAAGKAGVKPGDILQEIDSRRITTVNDIYAVLDEHQPGDMVKVRLLRPDKPEELGLPESKITFTPTSLDVMLLEVQEQGQRS